MHIETLKTFRDLVETGSFSKTAQLNLVSQSAVSQQLKMLEQRYDCQLLDRGSGRGVTLTDAGRAFYSECRLLLERFASLESSVRAQSTTIAGVVRVATVYSVGLHALPPYVTRFMAMHPQVTVHVEYSRTNRICDDCVHGTVDLGIVALPLPKASVTATEWRDEDLVIVCSPAHRLAARRRVSLRQLAGEPFVAFERDIPTRKTVDRLLRAHGVPVNRVMEFDNIETIKRCVIVGNGISILPQVTIANEVKSGVLVSVAIAEGPCRRRLAIIHRRGRILSGPARELLRLLQASS